MVELPENIGGAIRMLAYGVIEYTHIMDITTTFGEAHDEAVARSEEISALLMQDIHALGWKLARVAHRGGHNFTLLGRMEGSAALPTRPKIAQGTMQEVCLRAVDWLDKGPQPLPTPVR